MFSLYLKIAVRYLLKNKVYSFINIGGLAIGMASFMLIMLYVVYEQSYDKFAGSENVYRVFMDYIEGDIFVPGDAQSYNLAGPTFQREFPEVKNYVRFYRLDETTIRYTNQLFEIDEASVADPSFFDVFNQSLLEGDQETALKNPNTVVLTQSVAKKIFGNENPVGKTVEVFWGKPLLVKVTGILPDLPTNTHFKIKYLISYSSLMGWDAIGDQIKNPGWSNNSFYTYLQLHPSTDISALQQKIVESNFEDDPDERHNIEPISDIHLYSDKPYEAEVNGSGTRIRFLIAIALIILIVSWLNYMNLSTTKSMERAKEIGIRKVSGAHRLELILQSLIESAVINGGAIVLAFVLVLLVFPLYQNFIQKDFLISISELPSLWPIGVIIISGVFLAGFYPAILLSGFKPTKALKGKIQTSQSGILIRKGLIVLQFTGTIVLLVGTIVVTKQIRFLQDQPIGAELNRVVAVQGEILKEENDTVRIQQFKSLLQELENTNLVEVATLSQTYPGDRFSNLNSFMEMTFPDGVIDEKQIYYNYAVQPGFFDALGIKFLAGDTYTPNAAAQSWEEIVINEKMAKAIGFSDPTEALGAEIKFWNRSWKIIGILDNYHHFGLKTAEIPICFRYGRVRNNMIVKLNSAEVAAIGYEKSIGQIRDQWSSFFPESTFSYTFLDQKFQAQYEEDMRFNKAFGLFTMLAIFIASIGLFGLTSYTCLQRRKEIGVRKVNGASIFQILSLLNIGFIKWIGIAFIVAVPVSWYLMQQWLAGFAIKTDVSWWIFVLAAITTLLVTLGTVSWQSFKAATINPVDALRDE